MSESTDPAHQEPTELEMIGRPAVARPSSSRALPSRAFVFRDDDDPGPGAAGRRGGEPPTPSGESITEGSDLKATRNLALLCLRVCSAARFAEISALKVEDVFVYGDDGDGYTMTPLVDCTAADGSVCKGIIDRVGSITHTDIVDTEDASLYGSGLVAGVRLVLAQEKTAGLFHEVWYWAMPGERACPVRLLVKWLKAYDRLLVARTGARLAGHHPLFTILSRPGQPIPRHYLARIVRHNTATIRALTDACAAYTFKATHNRSVPPQAATM